jgi:hypothetical protein
MFIHELRCESISAAAATAVRSPISLHKFTFEKRLLGNTIIKLVVTSMFVGLFNLCAEVSVRLCVSVAYHEINYPSSRPQIHENG